jgi:hypothetical protein
MLLKLTLCGRWWIVEKNLSMQEDLYRLRSETQQAFDEAKALEARWKLLEREQRELHQVRIGPSIIYPTVND